jgi:PBP1b-binding outer membrane lipoprotein LpoB
MKGQTMRFAITALALLLSACSSSSSDTDTGSSSTATKPTLGVNEFLWRASLDTLNFMPLQSADPFGGIIITEWYSAPEDPNEQMKVTVYILDQRLRADGLKVAVFRQIRATTGWVDAQVNAETSTKLENAILSRARQLRLSALEH